MSDNISHEHQRDWNEWVDWIDAQDWTAFDWDDASGVTQQGLVLQAGNYADQLTNANPAVECSEDAIRLVCFDPQPNVQVSNGPDKVAKLGKRPKAMDKLLRCTEKGCTYTGTFARPWELQRHNLVKHDGVKKFSCSVQGCFKGTAAPSFARSDKLTSHIRGVHRPDSLTGCPLEHCNKTLPLDLLGGHMRFAHSDIVLWQQYQLQPVINAANTNYRKCPYWQCSKALTLDKFLDHLQSHTVAELEYMAADLRDQGYIFTSPKQAEKVVKISILCPVCNVQSESHETFAQHLYFTHMVDREVIERLGIDALTINKHGSNFEGMVKGLTSERREQCPCCKRAVLNGWGHRCLFSSDEDKVVTELRPYRQRILRLCPDFGKFKHFFDDL